MKKNYLRLLALVMALVMTAGLLPTAAMAAGTEPTATPATAPQETEPLPSESPPPAEPTEEPTTPETTVPETSLSEETTAPTVPETTEAETPPETTPETTAPAETEPPVPETTAPEETVLPTEPPFVTPTPLLEELPSDFQSKVQVPASMENNMVLEAMTELGYSVEELRNAGVLFDANYLSILLPRAYQTGIPYGAGSTGLETVEHIRSGGLVCASFVSYYLFNFLPRQGINTRILTESFTGSYASVPDLAGLLDAASQNYAYYDPNDDSELKVIKQDLTGQTMEQTQDHLKPGDVIVYGDLAHCSLYLGTADLVDSFTGEVLEPNARFIAHCGTDRGVEITTDRELEASGLIPTAVYSLEWNSDVAYFYLPAEGETDRAMSGVRASTIVIARKQAFYLRPGQDRVKYRYYMWKNGGIHTVNPGAEWFTTNCAYFELANGAIAYCLEPWVASPTPGNRYEEIVDPWNPNGYNQDDTHPAILGPDARKKQAVMKILACGAHNLNDKPTEAEKRATALFVWDAMCGYWDGNIASQTGKIADNGERVGNVPFYRSTWGYDSAVQAAYERISNRIKNSQKYPSFASPSSSNLGTANAFMLELNTANGRYEASKTDANGILGEYNFTTTVGVGDVTFSRSGNVLKISASEAAAKEIYQRGGVTASATGNFYDFGNRTMDMTVWGSTYQVDVQKFISLVNFNLKPVPVYIRLRATIPVQEGKIAVRKVDADNPNVNLPGAKFSLKHRTTGRVYPLGPTDNAGNAISAKIPVGTYDITEVQAPAGYLKSSRTWTVTVSKDSVNMIETFTAENAQIKGHIELKKTDSENGGWLNGAIFRVTHPSGTTTDVRDNGKGIYRIENLPYGTYKVQEIKAPEGYLLDSTVYTVNITEHGKTYTLATAGFSNIVNRPIKGHIQLQKINSETGAGLTGAVFQVTHPDGHTSYMSEGSNGVHSIQNLRYGSYKVQEVKAPEGYLLDPTVYTVNITENGKTYVVQTAGFNGIANEPIRGHFKVTKVEIGTTTPLQGAEYTVKAPDGSLIGVYTTDETGSFEVRDLLYGKGYTYQETKAPAGYLVDPTVYTFDITEDDRTYTYTREDAPQPGSISIQKVDSHGNPMPGVSFKLEYSLDDGGTWLPVTSRAPDAPLTPGTSSTPNIVDGALTTDAGGEIRFAGLRTDSQTGRVRYRLTEVATTNGHTLLAGTAFEGYITADKVDITIRAINGTAFELPTSGSTELAVVQLVGAAIIVLALIGFSATSFSSKLDQAEEKKKHRK